MHIALSTRKTNGIIFMASLLVKRIPCFLHLLAALSGKKSKSVFDFLTYLRETGFSFSYGEVVGLIQLIEASNEIDRVSKFDNSLSFGARQNALP